MRSRLMAKRPKMRASVTKVSVNAGMIGAVAHISATITARTMRPRISLFLAEHATRTDDQDCEHQQVHHGQSQILEIVGAEDLDERDKHAPDNGPEKTSHPADDDDNEGINDHVGSHAEEGGQQRCGEDAAERRQGAAEREDAGAHRTHVGTERMDHLGVLRDGAHEQAGAGSLEKLPGEQRGGAAHSDEEQPVDWERLIAYENNSAQPIRDWDA